LTLHNTIRKIIRTMCNSVLHDLIILFNILFFISFLNDVLDNSYTYDLFLYYIGVSNKTIDQLFFLSAFSFLTNFVLFSILLLIFSLLDHFNVWTRRGSYIVIFYMFIVICLFFHFYTFIFSSFYVYVFSFLCFYVLVCLYFNILIFSLLDYFNISFIKGKYMFIFRMFMFLCLYYHIFMFLFSYFDM
jgi:hypothetical protein